MKFIATIEITVNMEGSFVEQRGFDVENYAELFLKLNEYIDGRGKQEDGVLVDLISLMQIY